MVSEDTNPFRRSGVRAIFFDLMGTCLDWHKHIVRTLPARLDPKSRSALAIAWRESFFKDIHDQFEKKLPAEDIDTTHARLLKALLSEQDFNKCALSLHEQETAVEAWHSMTAWADIVPALSRLREKYEVFVLANGTTRLQLDLARFSGLRYDMLFSSQLLMLQKPDPEIYQKATRLVGVEPHEALMVAAHAYDLRAAKKVGMRTVYVRRWTEDTTEDMEQVQRDVDLFLGGIDSDAEGTGLRDGRLTELADLLCGKPADESSVMDEGSSSQ